MDIAPFTRCGPGHAQAPHPVVYELRASRPLPTIDCARYVKHVIFSSSQLQIANRVLHRGRLFFVISFLVGIFTSTALATAPAVIGRWIGLSLVVTEAPPIVATLISLRYDMLLLLLGVYEIWFASLLNLVSLVLLGVCMDDARGFAMVLPTLAFVLIVLLDANNRMVRQTVLVCSIATVLYIVFAVYVAFELIDGANTTLVILSCGTHELHAADVITNGLGTSVAILLRNAYRKSSLISRKNHCTAGQPGVVPCIAYRCLLQLVPAQAAIVAPAVRSAQSTEDPTREPLNPDCTAQLRFVPIPTQFDSSYILLCLLLSSRQYSYRFRSLLRVAGVAGLIATMISLASLLSHHLPYLVHVALLLTTAHCGVFIVHCQLQLLKRLATTFDFLFLSVHLTLAHLCVCDMVAWKPRHVALLVANWLWIHWVITLDALTPVWRTRLGLWRPLVLAAMVLCLAEQIVLCVEIFVWKRWDLRDRELFSIRIGSRSFTARVVPFLFSRVISIFCWVARLVWRFVAQNPHELKFLQGKVEYDDTLHMRRLQGHLQKGQQQQQQLSHKNTLVALTPSANT